MNLSGPGAAMQAASAAFETAANGISTAVSNASNNILSAGSTMSDSVDLSTSMAALMKANLDFTASTNLELVDNEMNQSTFSILG